jgi:hypothetical protein
MSRRRYWTVRSVNSTPRASISEALLEVLEDRELELAATLLGEQDGAESRSSSRRASSR